MRPPLAVGHGASARILDYDEVERLIVRTFERLVGLGADPYAVTLARRGHRLEAFA